MKADSLTSSAGAPPVYGRNKRPSPSSSIEIDDVPNKRRSDSSSPPIASTSATAALHRRPKESPVRPALRRTGKECELQSLLEPEYRQEVREYMYDLETRTMASVELIDMQPELQWYMRPYLVDFLIEVHQQHALRPETLYLAINIVDRYVSKRIVFKKHFQLVGCAALWIAAKFEDAKDRVPTVQDLCQSCCGAYEESAFVQMEGHVLSTIGWVIGHPTAEAWLRMACVQPTVVEEPTVQQLARFLMEVTLFHRGFVAFKPSDTAAGALLLARYILSERVAGPSKAEYRLPEPTPVGNPETALHIATLLDGHFAEHLDQVSAIVVKKYAFNFYHNTSTIAREWYLTGHRFVPPPPPPSPLSKSSAAMSSSPVYTRTRRSFADMSPSSDCSSSENEDDLHSEDGEYDEPITPITPMSSCSLVNPMDALATQTPQGVRPAIMTSSAPGKENLPRTAPHQRPIVAVSEACGMPGVVVSRPALNEWDPNSNAMSI